LLRQALTTARPQRKAISDSTLDELIAEIGADRVLDALDRLTAPKI
jgi:hypothetical protein